MSFTCIEALFGKVSEAICHGWKEVNATALDQIWVEAPESMIQYFPDETFSDTHIEKQVPDEGDCDAASGREGDPSDEDR